MFIELAQTEGTITLYQKRYLFWIFVGQLWSHMSDMLIHGTEWVVSLHHPLNATKVLESACSFSNSSNCAGESMEGFPVLTQSKPVLVWGKHGEKTCAKVLSLFGETTLRTRTKHNFIFFGFHVWHINKLIYKKVNQLNISKY